MLGASVRLFLVCVVLQLLVFDPIHLPFILNVFFTVALVWLYTFNGGVKVLIWTDTLKTCCLIISVVLCITFIASDLQLDFMGMVRAVTDNDYSKVFFFEKLIGVSYVREMIKDGCSADEIKKKWSDDVEKFKKQRAPYLLYQE